MDLLKPLIELQNDVAKKAQLRLEYDGLAKIDSKNGETSNNMYIIYIKN